MAKENFNEILVLVTAYNEENHIKDVIMKLSQIYKNILIINDSSTDKTYKLAASTKNCKVISHCINCGQGTALMTGVQYFLERTSCKYLITFDGDGQHKVSDSLKMINYALKNKLNALFGSRFIGEKKSNLPPFRAFFLKMATLFERVFFGIKLTDAHNGLRVLSRFSCEKIIKLNSSSMAHATEIPNILIKNGIEIIEYPCVITYSENNESSHLLNSLNIISDLLQKK